MLKNMPNNSRKKSEKIHKSSIEKSVLNDIKRTLNNFETVNFIFVYVTFVLLWGLP